MNDFEKKNDIVDTTDCLEAVSVFKTMKNFLFTVILICLLISQLIFWMNYLGYIDMTPCSKCRDKCILIQPASAGCGSCGLQCDISEPQSSLPYSSPVAMICTAVVMADTPVSEEPVNAGAVSTGVAEVEESVEKAAETVVKTAVEVKKEASESEAVDQKTEICETCTTVNGANPKWSLGKFDKYIPNICCVAWTLKVVNFILAMSAILYCLTLLMSIKISLAGRLGGLNHISRGFFRSLFMVIFLLPWQLIFPGVLLGALYTPAELFGRPVPAFGSDYIVCFSLYMLRFVGMWLLVIMLLFCSQSRSCKWTKATFRRLGILH